MRTIYVALQAPQLENAIQQFISQYHENIKNLVIGALHYYIKEIEQPLIIRKLNPLQHFKLLSIPFQAILNNGINR